MMFHKINVLTMFYNCSVSLFLKELINFFLAKKYVILRWSAEFQSTNFIPSLGGNINTKSGDISKSSNFKAFLGIYYYIFDNVHKVGIAIFP